MRRSLAAVLSLLALAPAAHAQGLYKPPAITFSSPGGVSAASGSGVAGQVAVFGGANTITSYAAFKWDVANSIALSDKFGPATAGGFLSFVDTGAVNPMRLDFSTGNTNLGNYQITWSSASAAATADTGLKRNAAGVLQVTDGSTGNGALLVGAGTGTGTVRVGGVICKGAPAATTTGTTEQALATCTIPANTLSVDGAMLRISYYYHTAANANNKQAIIRLGAVGSGNILANSTVSGFNNETIVSMAPVMVARRSSTTSTVFGAMIHGPDATAGTIASTSITYTLQRTPSVTWANSNDINFDCTTATSAGDCTLDWYTVEVEQ